MKDTLSDLKVYWVLLLIIAVISISGWAGYRVIFQPSLNAVADRSSDCMVKGDGACVYSSILERERSALGLSPAKVTSLLRDYVLPSYGPLTGAPTVTAEGPDDSGILGVSRTWNTSQRGPARFSAIAVVTPEGNRTSCTTQWLIFHAMEARYRTSPNEENLMIYIDGLKHDADLLTKLGIPGVYKVETNEVIKWPELLKQYQESAVKVGWLPAN